MRPARPGPDGIPSRPGPVSVRPQMASGRRVRHTHATGKRRRKSPMRQPGGQRDGQWTDAAARTVLRDLFATAVQAADPRRVLAAHLPPKPERGRCIVVGGGQSGAVMAAALEQAWPDVPLEGTVVTRYGHAVPTDRIEVIEASHPVPDENSERGALRLLERV